MNRLGDWASPRGGKWHKLASSFVDFTTPVRAICGKTFEPLRVSDFIPEHIAPDTLCPRCAKATA